jgi:hypothetical protein
MLTHRDAHTLQGFLKLNKIAASEMPSAVIRPRHVPDTIRLELDGEVEET